MAHPHHHAQSSQRKFDIPYEKTIDIHCFLDSTKAFTALYHHRYGLHNSFGISACQIIFTGDLTSDEIAKVAGEHIIEDLGFIPNIVDITAHLPTNILSEKKSLGPRKRHLNAIGEDAPTWIRLIENTFGEALPLFLNSFGPFLLEKLLGEITHIFNKEIPVRFAMERYILAATGEIQDFSHVIRQLPDSREMYANALALSKEHIS